MKVADYLIKVLVGLGVTDYFGLPGDYNFDILYAIRDNEEASWIGCTNELNAGYAADGYARVKGYGAVVTTYGVGELSAINAIAGSFAENVPVIHIVGVPATNHIQNNVLLHHNFQNPNYYAFQKAFEPVVETTAYLTKDNAKQEIDRIIEVFRRTKRPVYLAIPMDIALMNIDAEVSLSEIKSDKSVLKDFLDTASNIINSAKSPVIIGDTLIKRYQCEELYKNFAEESNIPTSNFLMGTGIIDFDKKNYLGTYISAFGNDTACKYLTETDCAISVGPIYSDLNTFGFSLPYKPDDHIAIYGTYSIIKNKKYDNIMMEDVLRGLVELVNSRDNEIYVSDTGYKKSELKDEKLTSDYIYPRLQEFFKPNDLLFIETGIIMHGFSGMKLPSNIIANTQTLWGSIGWATPATLGGCLADKTRRTILFTGEGSHQLTATEIGNMMRQGIKPIVIVLNNSGYTIERILSNDPEDEFNNITDWNYSKLPELFAGDVWIAHATTDKEFDTALKLAEQQDKLCYIEIFTEKMDLPFITAKTIERLNKQKQDVLEKTPSFS